MNYSKNLENALINSTNLKNLEKTSENVQKTEQT